MLEQVDELFHLSHDLVQNCPQDAETWYTIGCYYMSIKDHHEAAKYFAHAPSL
jgi:anaphase-promoting complex subunit 6